MLQRNTFLIRDFGASVYQCRRKLVKTKLAIDEITNKVTFILLFTETMLAVLIKIKFNIAISETRVSIKTRLRIIILHKNKKNFKNKHK